MIQVGLGLPHGAEAAIRVWSSLDPHVHSVQAAVDRQRYDIMYESAFEILKSERQAQVFAAWAVYLLVGYEQAACPRPRRVGVDRRPAARRPRLGRVRLGARR